MTAETDRYSILVVDDDDDTAELLTQQLEREGHSVEIAKNGQEAILRTSDSPPDLVIMDVMMPKLDGFEATRFLKAKFRGRFVPVMVLSARHGDEDIQRGVRFGCDDYMTKPYRRQALVASVRELLELGQLETALLKRSEGAEDSGGDDLERRAFVARVAIAKRLLGEGRAVVARSHLDRAQEIAPGDAEVVALLGQVGG